MCGFAGVLTARRFTQEEMVAQIRRMIDPIAHRGPDDSGIWVDEQAGVALGFRRLSILDLSASGHQPMRSASGRFIVVFNGEVYNFGELRDELEGRGHRFRGHSDTEVILAAFDEWGVDDAVRRLTGMFAIAVWDTSRRELSLVRDRLGKKPLYVYTEPGLITFGSELKALFAGPAFDRTIDRTALALYLRYLYVPAPRTIFRRAIKLLPAHILTVGDPARPLPVAQRYWSLEEAALYGLTCPRVGADADLIDELDALLVEAVRCRLRSDVPLGALLSGGLDSSTVVALMQEVGARPVKTYTIGFAEEAFDEARHAARVAAHLGTDHTEALLSGEGARALVPQLPEIFDEPFADPSQLPTLLVSRVARRHVTVALCGDGGDEVFGGYNRYVHGTGLIPWLERLPRTLRRPIGAVLQSVPVRTWDRLHHGLAGARLAGGHVGERLHKLGAAMRAASAADMYCSLLSAWQRPETLLSEDASHQDPNRRVFDLDQPAALLDRMMLTDQLVYLPDDLLAKMDRASMAVSLEVRSPLLDHRVVEFAWRLPREMKLRGTTGKWALRQVLYRRVPKELVERQKMGFSVPIAAWLRGPLRAWAEDLLFGDALARDGPIEPRAVARAWKDLLDDIRPVGLAVWSVIMFQAWRARWGV